MRLVPAGLDGAYFVDLAVARDDRGSFARTYCRDAFRDAGIDFEPVQCNLSRNPAAGTLRGMHYQRPPHGEAKLVQCVRGRIFDVAVDLRRASPTFGAAVGVELAADGDRLFYIPEGCAHGFLTRAADSDILYYMGKAHAPGTGAGVRWDDPAFAIPWPEPPRLISDRDASYPDFDPAADGLP